MYVFLFFFPHKAFCGAVVVALLCCKVTGLGWLGRGHVTQTAPWGRRTGPAGPGPAGSWCWCTWARWRAAADRGAAAGRWRGGGPEQAGTRGRVPCWRRADSTCTQPGSTPPLDASQSPVRKVGNKKVKRREKKKDKRQWRLTGVPFNCPPDFHVKPRRCKNGWTMLTTFYSSQWNSMRPTLPLCANLEFLGSKVQNDGRARMFWFSLVLSLTIFLKYPIERTANSDNTWSSFLAGWLTCGVM